MPKKYSLPPFLGNKVSQESYERWLQRKAQAHVKRDRQRGNSSASGEAYREAIHNAVIESNSLDAYTGEPLDWKLISQYDNSESKKMGRDYKKKFALLPTVDHIGDGKGPANFRICGWRTNDAKNDLDPLEFITLCESVLKHQALLAPEKESIQLNAPLHSQSSLSSIQATVDKQTNKLKINPRSWYAWQMIPGYIGERNVPYSSPIFVERVVPKKTEKGTLTLDFVNVLYAEGVQGFTLDLKVLKHSSDYLIADLLYGPEGPDRAVIISHIEFAWIERFCPGLWNQRPPFSIGGAATGSVSIYLSEVFGLGKEKG
jgi:hypothetical protein